ncbi:MAG: polyprenyl synthetase family protein [Tissierellia bacterium]|nr:polyprenyl synthetase family protein [Tissierellia bacterium]
MFDKYKLAQEEFNETFLSYFKSDSLFSQALNYSIAQGKRIRPVILIETYKMLSGKDYTSKVLNFATALELIHNYSLVHDDLPALDDDDYRRGRLTVHKKFREDIAILVGDGLLNQAFELMAEEIVNSDSLESMRASAHATKTIAFMAGVNGMIGGQVIDVLEASKDVEEILDMYEKKTCALIMAATLSAAYLAHADQDTIEDMRNLGRLIGLCFQLQDDLLDSQEDEKISKITYITYKGQAATQTEIDKLTQQTLDILEKYENNDFLVNLVKSLVNRKY